LTNPSFVGIGADFSVSISLFNQYLRLTNSVPTTQQKEEEQQKAEHPFEN
jgi:hypothetical protein